ncbi:MAG: hypothetical protein CMQ40_00430 [Gammaproteobacteria bacterium]|nr:hypothetical protein [Gammaproteobacteria bacterium]
MRWFAVGIPTFLVTLIYSEGLHRSDSGFNQMTDAKLLIPVILGVFFMSEAGAELISGFPYSECFEQAAEDNNFDPSFIAAVASVESGLDPNAVSSADALGLMQIKWPLTAKELGIDKREDLFLPCVNINAGARYLGQLTRRFESSLLGLAAYHVGPTRVSDTGQVPARALTYIQKILDEEKLIRVTEQLAERVVERCRPEELMQLGLITHDPRKRRRVALDWLNEYEEVCSISQLVFIKNRVQVWFGTADSSGSISDKVSRAISEREMPS